MTKRGIALVGATGTGKTALSTRLAHASSDLELVSIDAMAVYRALDIGTAKPTREERDGVVWHLIDVVDPEEEFSVERFQHLAADALRAIAARDHRALLVGGSGLYHRSIIDELTIPERYPAIARDLDARAEKDGGGATLYAELATLDPLGALRMNPTNTRRVVRALEVTLGSGRPFSSFGPGLTRYGPSAYRLIGLDCARDELHRRIEARLDAQFAAGFLDEVRSLLSRPEGLSRTARQALGYRELIAHLEGECSFASAREEILRRTKRFARRQLAWFRRDPRITWFDATAPDLEALVLGTLGDVSGGEGEGRSVSG